MSGGRGYMSKVDMNLRYILDLVNKATQNNYDGSQTNALMQLRLQISAYLKNETPAQLQSEIGSLTSIRELKFILGANPKGLIYEMVWAKLLSLKGQDYGFPRDFSKLPSQGLNR